MPGLLYWFSAFVVSPWRPHSRTSSVLYAVLTLNHRLDVVSGVTGFAPPHFSVVTRLYETVPVKVLIKVALEHDPAGLGLGNQF